MALKGWKLAQEPELALLDRVLESGWIKNRRSAIDGGAHVGGWSQVLAGAFERVIAFEPCPETFGILQLNMEPYPNVECRPEALLDRGQPVTVYAPKRKTLTARRVMRDPKGQADAIALDDLGLNDVDLIKLDLEGAEYPAVEGALRTLRRCRPFVIVEMIGMGKRFHRSDEDLHNLLQIANYRRVASDKVNMGYAPL